MLMLGLYIPGTLQLLANSICNQLSPVTSDFKIQPVTLEIALSSTEKGNLPLKVAWPSSLNLLFKGVWTTFSLVRIKESLATSISKN
jgi:hypothetical protein